nr:DoxX family protein [Paenibacillus bovis]
MSIVIVLKGILIFMFVMLGMQKIVGHPMQVEIFNNLKLPQWFRIVTGWVQLVGVLLLVIGFWVNWMNVFAGIWLGITMLGAFISHLRIKDPIGKSMPAFVFCIISFVLVFVSY